RARHHESTRQQMSDVTVAPNASPPPVNETVIEQHQTTTPQPLGSQAPQKQGADGIDGSEHRPQSRREAIQAAFKRAADAKPAPARMGNNTPPEPMEREKPAEKPEPVNLRKRPTDQPRGEHGHFGARQEATREDHGRLIARTPQGEAYREGQQRP